MNKWLFILFISSTIFATDFQKKIGQYKAEDNLQLYIYTYLDEAAIPKNDALKLLADCEQSLWRKATIKKEQLALVYLYANYGYYLKKSGQLKQATQKYEAAWQIFSSQKLSRFEIYESCLKPLANIYTRLGDYEKAIYTHKSILENAQEANNDELVTGTLINIAVIYYDIGRIQDAIDLLMQAKNTDTLSDFHHFLIYSKLAKNYLSLNEPIKAKQITKQLRANTAYKKAFYFKLNAAISSQNKRYDRAQYYLREALNELKRSNASKREIAKTLVDLAKSYDKLHNLELSHSFADKALNVLLDNTKYKPQELQEKLYAENTFKAIFDFKAHLYTQNGKAKQALVNLDLAFYIDELLRETYSYQESKLLLQKEIRKRSEQAIINCLMLHDTLRAFRYAQKSKSLILSEEINYKNSLNKLQNKELVQLSTQLKQEIAQLKSKPRKLAVLNQKVQQLDSINTIISSKYSLDSKQAIRLTRMQQHLKTERNTMLLFFEGTVKTYLFQLDKDKLKLSQFYSKNSLEFVQLFQKPHILENNFNKYKTLAFELYNTFKINTIKTDNILIIPDGIYSVFPFDALLSKKSSVNSFAKLPYLIQQKSINLSYSPSIYFNNSRTATLKNVLGIFPIFKNSKHYLKYSEEELKVVQRSFEGLFLTAENANKANFLNNCSTYDIIHISTHAESNEMPYIQFKDSILKLEEIYGLSLQSDLIVLSACKTGTGRIQKGAGALSLARGFKYAGVSSIIQSLWQVNDLATTQLMDGFYTNLIKQNNKAQALHYSKLDYLNNKTIKSLKKSPYYWASFQYYGNLDNSKLSSKNNLNYYWLISIPLVLLFVYYIKKRP